MKISNYLKKNYIENLVSNKIDINYNTSQCTYPLCWILFHINTIQLQASSVCLILPAKYWIQSNLDLSADIEYDITLIKHKYIRQ